MARRTTRTAAWVDSALTRRVVGWGLVPLACLIGLVMLLGIGGLTWHASPTYGHQAHARARDVGTVPLAVSRPDAAGTPVSPTRIDIPKLHASAPIVKVATTPDGELQIPQNPLTVGWWSPGARPGASEGTAILAGHINYGGRDGALGHIGELDPGDTFSVHGSVDANRQRTVTFRVTGVRTYHKTHLPYRQIFDQSSVGRVALVTCGGPFDNATGNYLDNIVVFGVPVAST